MTVDSLSPEAQIKAAATLARSGAIAMVLRWALMIGVPAITGLGGWITAKLDTKNDLVELRQAIAGLTQAQKELTGRIDAAVPALQAQITGVQHDAVVATGAAIAWETERRAKDKLAAGVVLGSAYTAMVQRGEPSGPAAQSVIANVAVPHAPR